MQLCNLVIPPQFDFQLRVLLYYFLFEKGFYMFEQKEMLNILQEIIC